VLATVAASVLSGSLSSLTEFVRETDLTRRLAERLETGRDLRLHASSTAALPDTLRGLFLRSVNLNRDPLLGLWLVTRGDTVNPGPRDRRMEAGRLLRRALPREALHAVLDLDAATLERALAGEVVVGRVDHAALGSGLTDTHLHSGGATEAGEILAALLPRLAGDTEPRDAASLVSYDAFGRPLNLLPLLLGLGAAALSMYVLRGGEPATRSVTRALIDRFDVEWWDELRDLAEAGTRLDPAAFAAHRATLQRTSAETGLVPQMRDVYQGLTRGFAHTASCEVALLARRGLVTLCCLHTALSSPLKSSLGSFVARFELMRMFRGCLGKIDDRIERTLLQMYVDGGVTSCELRKTIGVPSASSCSVERLVSQIKEDVLEHAAGASAVCRTLNGPDMTVRMPISFLRDRPPRDLASRAETYAPFRVPLGSVLALADAIVVFIDRYPSAARFVGAVDVAGDERSVPNWLYALAYQRIAATMTSCATLEFAAHVGEYFNHQLEGVRRVAELRLFGPQVRRAGHCLALSSKPLRPDANGSTAAVVLEDLIWTLMVLKGDERLGLGPIAAEVGGGAKIASCTRLIIKLSREVFGDYVPISALCDWYVDRFDLERVSKLVPELELTGSDLDRSWPDGVDLGFAARPDDLRAGLLFVTVLQSDLELRTDQRVLRLHFDDSCLCPSLEQAARDLVAALIAPLVSLVSHWMAHSGVVVESCPSSNLSLGQMEMIDHPVFTMRDAGIACSVSTDDPAIFGSNVRDEYLHLGAAAAALRPSRDGIVDELVAMSRTAGTIQDPLTGPEGSAAAYYNSVVDELS